MKYIYLVELSNGLLYVGRHKWNGEGLDPHYSGSGKRLKPYKIPNNYKDYGYWDLPEGSKFSMLEDCSTMSDFDYYGREVYWITHYAKLYGVIPYYSGHLNLFVREYARPTGRLLNCHNTKSPNISKCVWYIDSEGPYCMQEVSGKLDNHSTAVASAWSWYNHPGSFYWNGYHIHKEGCEGGPVIDREHPTRVCEYIRTSDSARKSVESRKATGEWYEHHSNMVDLARDPNVRARAVATRKQNVSNFRPKYTNGEFTGDFEQIAEYIGYTGKYIDTVSKYLRGVAPIPARYSILSTFHLVN